MAAARLMPGVCGVLWSNSPDLTIRMPWGVDIVNLDHRSGHLCYSKYEGELMQLGMIGLGRMGGNMVRRLTNGGHSCVVFDLDAARVHELEATGSRGAAGVSELVAALAKPRAVWIMVPAGEPTEQMVKTLA